MCRRVVGLERDGDGLRTEKKDFSLRRFCVYIGRFWHHRKNKDCNTLYRT